MLRTGATEPFHFQTDTDVEPGRGDRRQQPVLVERTGLEPAVPQCHPGRSSRHMAHETDASQVSVSAVTY